MAGTCSIRNNVLMFLLSGAYHIYIYIKTTTTTTTTRTSFSFQAANWTYILPSDQQRIQTLICQESETKAQSATIKPKVPPVQLLPLHKRRLVQGEKHT